MGVFFISAEKEKFLQLIRCKGLWNSRTKKASDWFLVIFLCTTQMREGQLEKYPVIDIFQKHIERIQRHTERMKYYRDTQIGGCNRDADNKERYRISRTYWLFLAPENAPFWSIQVPKAFLELKGALNAHILDFSGAGNCTFLEFLGT